MKVEFSFLKYQHRCAGGLAVTVHVKSKVLFLDTGGFEWVGLSVRRGLDSTSSVTVMC